MRAYLFLVMACAVAVAGCGTNTPVPTNNSGGSGGYSPANDPCWCYTDPELDSIYTVLMIDWSNGWSYDYEIGVALTNCPHSCCVTCGTAAINEIWLGIPMY